MVTEINRTGIETLINQIIERLSSSIKKDDTSGDAFKVVGLAIWDVLSNNNTVVDSIGGEFNLGSWREAAGTIANLINNKSGEEFDSSDFFRGTEYVSELKPEDQLDHYTAIFLLLHELGSDWRYGSEIEYNVCVTDPFPVQAYKSVFKK